MPQINHAYKRGIMHWVCQMKYQSLNEYFKIFHLIVYNLVAAGSSEKVQTSKLIFTTDNKAISYLIVIINIYTLFINKYINIL